MNVKVIRLESRDLRMGFVVFLWIYYSLIYSSVNAEQLSQLISHA